MNPFHNLPINKKISRSILVTSLSALLLSSLAIIIYEFTAFRKSAVEEVITLADIVGANSTGALAFGDKAAATDILSHLRDRTSIMAARIYASDGSAFATYARRSEFEATIPATALSDHHSVFNGRLNVIRPIRFKEDRIGSIFIESDMDIVYQRLAHYVGIVIAVVALLIPFVLLLSAWLQRLISHPIRDLAKVANEVAIDKNYSIRSRAVSDDEVGQLTVAFNHMLDTIEERNQQLVNQSDELWRSNKELEQFAYVSSHDLQEPLRKITTYAQLLQDRYKGKLDIEGDKFIENICVCVNRMRTLINDLLAYSRVSRQQDSSEQLDLNKTIQDILLDLEPVLNESRAVVTKELLPTITGNSFEMQQLFQNLLTNAIKFHGSDQPKVHISCQKNEKEWLIGVHDNGIGIDKKYHDQIFKVFQRLHGRDSYPGTGIGLAICKKIVEQHGGKIWVTSQVNSGSHFYFTWLLNQPAPKHELNPV